MAKRTICGLLLTLACAGCGTPPVCTAGDMPKPPDRMLAAAKLSSYDNGIVVTSATDPAMTIHYWIFEWTIFDAIALDEEVSGYQKGTKNRKYPVMRNIVKRARKTEISEDGRRAVVTIKSEADPKLDMTWTFTARPDGADIELRIKNTSDRDWPELASLTPCFHPGVGSKGSEAVRAKRKEEGAPEPPDAMKPNYAFCPKAGGDKNTSFATEAGLKLFPSQSAVTNVQLKEALAEPGIRRRIRRMGAERTQHGFIVRQSNDGAWTTGIAWDRFLYVQAGNPYRCMHMPLRVGPLAKGETATLRGRIWLFKGSPNECFKRYQAEFAKPPAE
jgi:hypothetical protein